MKDLTIARYQALAIPCRRVSCTHALLVSSAGWGCAHVAHLAAICVADCSAKLQKHQQAACCSSAAAPAGLEGPSVADGALQQQNELPTSAA